MARHGRSRRERTALLRRAALAVAFLVAVAVVPALLVTLPGRDAAPDPPAVAAPSTTAAGSTPPVAPTIAVPTRSAVPTLPRATTVPPAGGVAGLPVPPTVIAGPPPPRTSFQEFPSVCAPAGPGTVEVPPRGVVAGTYFGVPPGGGGTSCLYGTDRSTYWAPALLSGGAPVAPEIAEVYYKSGIRDYRTVRAFPRGLTLLAPDATAAVAAGVFASWSCGEGDALSLPTSCPAGAKLILRLQAPSCWDGARLDSPDHRAHLAFPVRDRCPGGHPVPVPMLEMKVVYPLPAGILRLSLSTGAGPSSVFRYVSNWDPAAQAKLVANCLHRGRRCNDEGVDPDNP